MNGRKIRACEIARFRYFPQHYEKKAGNERNRTEVTEISGKDRIPL